MNGVGHAPEFAIAAGLLIALQALLRLAWRLRRLGVAARGRAAIAAPLVLLGKLAAAVPLVALGFAVLLRLREIAPDQPLPRTLAALLFLAASAVGSAALGSLGADTRIGLPREATTLRTDGIYRFSRNPMYLAIVLAHAAAIIYAPGLWTVVPAAISGWIHHRIVRVEELFLAARFGEQYAIYRRGVRRYL